MSKYIDVDKIKWREEYQECRCHYDRWEEKVTRVYKRDIDAMTPADVIPVVHGHWKTYEHKDSYGVLVTGYQCSNCGEGISYNEWRQEHFSDYCPECGCKMDEEVK